MKGWDTINRFPCSSIASFAGRATLTECITADCRIASHRMFYGQSIQGHRSVGGERKRFKDHIKSILKKCNIPFNRLEALASNRLTWRSTCVLGMSNLDTEYHRAAAHRYNCRHLHVTASHTLLDSSHQCPL